VTGYECAEWVGCGRGECFMCAWAVSTVPGVGLHLILER